MNETFIFWEYFEKVTYATSIKNKIHNKIAYATDILRPALRYKNF